MAANTYCIVCEVVVKRQDVLNLCSRLQQADLALMPTEPDIDRVHEILTNALSLAWRLEGGEHVAEVEVPHGSEPTADGGDV